jgi:Mrp family chromosome partitioning ATPase/capsular polysaccharide biosynthesis protein
VSYTRADTKVTTPRDFLRVLLRRSWVIVLVVMVATGGAFLLSSRQTKMYRTSAQMVYEPQITAGYSATGQSAVNPYGQQDAVQGVATAINNPAIRQQTAAAVDSATPYTLTAQQEGSANSNALVDAVVTITATSRVPAVARAAANAFATSFITSSKRAQVAQLDNALTVIKQQMATFTTPAARASSSYLLLAQSAQNLQVGKAMATGGFSLTVPATLPSGPYRPRPLVTAALALGISLFVAVGLVLLLEQFNTKLRSHREVADALDLPVIGRVPRVKRRLITVDPLAVVHDTRGPAAESLRLLRSNLDYLDVTGALSTVLVTSGMPGEGKSVTVCNLGVTLAMGGRRVVLVDADLRRPSLHRYMGLSNTVGVSSVVAGKVPLAKALQGYNLPPLDWNLNGGSHNGNGSKPVADGSDGDAKQPARRLYLLAAGPMPPNPGEIVASERFKAIFTELKESSVDFVLIDSPAFMSVSDAAAIAPYADGVLALVDMGRATRPGLGEVKDFLDRLPTRKLGVIVVREKPSRSSYHGYYQYAGARRV